MTARLDSDRKTISVEEKLTFRNETGQPLNEIVFNDWNNAFSTKDSPLGRRFSDEFIKSFHLAKEKERGSSQNLKITFADGSEAIWKRPEGSPDLIILQLPNKLSPGQSLDVSITFDSKIPSAKFTRYGYTDDGNYQLRDWLITPARFENGDFLRYNNQNLDDISNGFSDYEIDLSIPENLDLVCDLDVIKNSPGTYRLNGKNRNSFGLYIGDRSKFNLFTNDNINIENGIDGRKVTDIQKALIVDKISKFVTERIGDLPRGKIMVSEEDYARNPVYGLNQLPGFLAPFSDAYLYELKFLKTYLHNFLQQGLKLDQRKDNWIFDGYQVYLMMEYMEEFYPQGKMMGNIASLKLLKSFHLVNLNFNEQYAYYYMLMARRNLDQPIGFSKDRLIKFNEQIAGKYRAGLSFKYLDDYLGNETVPKSIKEFYTQASVNTSSRAAFENKLTTDSGKNLDWFFDTIIDSRDIIDYTFEDVEKTTDSISVKVKNRTGTTVPIPVFGVKGHNIVYKQWIDNIATDTIIKFPRNGAEKIVINYQNEVPEFNMRNNWKSLKNFPSLNRPLKFNFMKDLEDPFYNQVMYVPSFEYNLYDGIALGLRFHNKTLLEKPFTFDVSPSFGLKSKTLVGSGSVAYNQYFRNSRWYNARYSLSGNYFHYAPDALYYKINPMLILRRRETDFRENRKETLLIRDVIVHREATNYVIDDADQNENYNVFNLRYSNAYMEAIKTLNFQGDFQVSKNFGKVSGEVIYRHLFLNNRQLNLRLFAGAFLYNDTTNDFFSFALDRPTDYLFDYNYYGRSESSGLFSQQLILSEGGFKSMLQPAFANRWITTANASFNIWNWIELYGDAGFVKNKGFNPKFVYDSGVRLNLVTDYFELYFPVYSNLGWEVGQPNYGEKIRFIVTIDPKTLISLFTRKWL
ncbi:M1 family metallopeptidase [Flavobacterium sp. SE-s28]|uniref:M1 family metallopeptidase n=1 Tax=Flavobacterium silvaticum TaxID=1852020 RepID=A0A972JGL2_9FLAO|nr:M1 family metallopeptidase [Flavobacterium silvaticum]